MKWRVASALLLAAACAPPADEPPAPDLTRLEQTRNDLRERLAELRGHDERLQQVPAGGVTIGVPIDLFASLVQEVTAGFLSQVRISLRDLRLHEAGDVKVKRLFAMNPGRYSLGVRLHEVRGLLEPGAPQVSFEGNRLGIELPVSLAKGEGRATIDFKWDSRGIASAVCEDFSATEAVSGAVAPRRYTLRGAFELRVDGGMLVAEPRFRDLVVNLKVEPSPEAWAAVARLLEERSWKCEKALKMVDVERILKGVLDKGFNVRVPAKLFRPIRIPAALGQSLDVEGREYRLSIEPKGLTVTPEILWFGAGVQARVESGR